ncbi:MAG: 30S ribosomal protein S17 [Deltaproteobacteria bacterium]|nr:30S ribosomal protein S17 [Deltaproteobacteria bacterium]
MSEGVEQGAVPEATAEATEDRHTKERRGVVVSAKMNKTVIVAVERRIRHRKYKKYITVRKRYAAHDTIGVQEGDVVLIRETRPMSKTKRWRVSRKLERGE